MPEEHSIHTSYEKESALPHISGMQDNYDNLRYVIIIILLYF